MVNQAILVGRLASTPELRETSDGTKVASVTLVIDRPRKKEDGTRDADFITVTAWRGQAEFLCNYFKQGDLISVVGSIRTRLRTNKDGQEFKSVEVNADELGFCGYRKGQVEE